MTDHYSDADLLALRSLPVPPEVSRVQGCTCGGLDWHAQDCGLFELPVDEAGAAVQAAHQRLHDRSAALTTRLRALIDAARPEGSST